MQLFDTIIRHGGASLAALSVTALVMAAAIIPATPGLPIAGGLA